MKPHWAKTLCDASLESLGGEFQCEIALGRREACDQHHATGFHFSDATVPNHATRRSGCRSHGDCDGNLTTQEPTVISADPLLTTGCRSRSNRQSVKAKSQAMKPRQVSQSRPQAPNWLAASGALCGISQHRPTTWSRGVGSPNTAGVLDCIFGSVGKTFCSRHSCTDYRGTRCLFRCMDVVHVVHMLTAASRCQVTSSEYEKDKCSAQGIVHRLENN